MLWIEGVRGGPLCRVFVQCSQVSHDHSALEKTEVTLARHHSTHVCRGAAVPRALTAWGPGLIASGTPSASPAHHLLRPTMLSAMGQLTLVD